MIVLAAFAVFSGLSVNPLLQFAMGAAGAVSDAPRGARKKIPLFQFGVLFVSALFLWAFFSWIPPLRRTDFFRYFLFFPLSVFVCMGLELLGKSVISRMFPEKETGGYTKLFSALTAYDGLVPVCLFVTLTLASNFREAFILVLFFVFGNIAAMISLFEIRRRSAMEWVPRFLRGSPLVLISMGLLSLVSASAAGICFRILEAF